jgi:hypothetical protein
MAEGEKLSGAVLVVGAYNTQTVDRLRFGDGRDAWPVGIIK